MFWRKGYISIVFNDECRSEVRPSDLHSFFWIENIPKSACVYVDSSNEPCQEINDKEIIQSLVDYINDGIDWDDQSTEPRSHKKTYKFDHVTVELLYEGDMDIYLKSDRGTKLMKPEPEFLKIINQ
ncbi:MAG: hypothetical protein ACQEU4_04960 [Bacillota bacterium]